MPSVQCRGDKYTRNKCKADANDIQSDASEAIRMAATVEWLNPNSELLSDVLRIDSDSFEHSDRWSREEMKEMIGIGNGLCMCRVAMVDDEVAGFVVYECYPVGRKILKIAVDHRCRRRGVGKSLLDRLTKIMQESPRIQELIVDVSEHDVASQLFFRSQGFRWVETINSEFDDLILYVMRKSR